MEIVVFGKSILSFMFVTRNFLKNQTATWCSEINKRLKTVKHYLTGNSCDLQTSVWCGISILSRRWRSWNLMLKGENYIVQRLNPLNLFGIFKYCMFTALTFQPFEVKLYYINKVMYWIFHKSCRKVYSQGFNKKYGHEDVFTWSSRKYSTNLVMWGNDNCIIEHHAKYQRSLSNHYCDKHCLLKEKLESKVLLGILSKVK